MKKEKIDLDLYISNFKNELEHIIELKEKIENEILKINDLYEKINGELKKKYDEKYEELKTIYEEKYKKLKEEYENNCERILKEENNLKEVLENKVTDIKEKLENALTDTNDIIKENEKINKGIKVLSKKQEEKNIIINLSYISKINKNKKRLKSISEIPMKNMEIYFNKKKNDLIFDEYYFNGFPCPNNIKFSYDESLNIIWSKGNSNLINIDENKLKFRVEMKIENENFKVIYEGKNNTCRAENLNEDKIYEIKISSLYNNIVCSSSEIIKLKPRDLMSSILLELQKDFDYIQTVLDWSGYKKMKLLYRGTRDGSLSQNFHEKCDNHYPTITLFKNDSGHIFGGFASVPWSNKGADKKDKDSFIFTLSNKFNTEPTKFVGGERGRIIIDSEFGPSFGLAPNYFGNGKYDILVKSDFLKEKSLSEFPYLYEDTSKKKFSIFTSSESKYFQLKEIEVFKLFK